MAVYERTYRPYLGEVTPAWSRSSVISRYALQDVFRSRLFLAFFVLCFVWPFICSIFIYAHHNLEARELFGFSFRDLFAIDAAFFRSWYLAAQLSAAFTLIFIVGPALVSPDLRNGGLPLYLSRPIGKLDYVLGKLGVLLILTSAITWVPGEMLLFMQGFLVSNGFFGDDGFVPWLAENARIGVALFLGSMIWTVALSIFSLAISAMVKWKMWARIFFLGFFAVCSAMGGILLGAFGSWHGGMLILLNVQDAILAQLFALAPVIPLDMPVIAPWVVVGFLCALSAWLLSRRIRAFELVS